MEFGFIEHSEIGGGSVFEVVLLGFVEKGIDCGRVLLLEGLYGLVGCDEGLGLWLRLGLSFLLLLLNYEFGLELERVISFVFVRGDNIVLLLQL